MEEINVDTELLELENNIIGTDVEIMNSKFSMEELNRAIMSYKDKSSPGMDGIEYKMIKGLCQGMKEIMLILFNEVFERGYLFYLF